jgi:hypothetical protein
LSMQLIAVADGLAGAIAALANFVIAQLQAD